MDHTEDFCRSFTATSPKGETRRTRIYGSEYLASCGGWDVFVAALRCEGWRITDIVVSYGEVPTIEEILGEHVDEDKHPRGHG